MKFTETLFNKINFKPLEDEISRRINVPVTLSATLKDKRNDTKGIGITTQNLINECGVLNPVMDAIHIKEFSTGYNDEKNTYWINVSYRWTFKSGGSNGTTLFDAWWNFNTLSWIFKGRNDI